MTNNSHLIASIPDRGAVAAWSKDKATLNDVIAVGSKDSGGAATFDDYGGELELFQLNLTSSAPKAADLLCKVKTTARFACIDWSHCGQLLAGGLVDGTVAVWKPQSIISSSSYEGGGLLSTITEHKAGAAVSALQFNPHASSFHLMGSGGSDGQVLITSFERPDAPNVCVPAPDHTNQMNAAEVTKIAWNPQVAHIVASSSGNGTCTVWDLRQKKPWCELRCEPSNVAVSDIVWNPTEGLHILTASAEDPTNLMKLWDLRASTTMPLGTLNSDGKGSGAGGILSCSWCPDDPSLLVSCGKDNRTLLWDLYAMEPIYELPNDKPSATTEAAQQANGPSFASSSFQDKRYSIQWAPNKRGVISTCSFDRKVQVHSLIGAANHGERSQRTPKWLHRKSGVSFGFGGKLVSFGSNDKNVTLSHVKEDPVLVDVCTQFESAIASNNDYGSYCHMKAVHATDSFEQQMWGIMQRVLFEENARQALLQFLGFDADEIAQLAAEHSVDETCSAPVSNNTSNKAMSKESEQLVMKALLVGNFEAAVDCCVKSGNFADALILSSYGGAELWTNTQALFFTQEASKRPFLSVVDAVINDGLANLVATSDLSNWKQTLGIISTYGSTEEFPTLCTHLGDRLNEAGNLESSALCYICGYNMDAVVKYWISQFHRTSQVPGNSFSLSLHQFVEKVTVFSQACPGTEIPEEASNLFAEYSKLLADQGVFGASARYCRGQACDELKSRLYYGGGYECQTMMASSPPAFPFIMVNIGASPESRGISTAGKQQERRNTATTLTSNSQTARGSTKTDPNQLPPGWIALQDPASGRTYYANQSTGVTTWEKPAMPKVAPAPAPVPSVIKPATYQSQQTSAYQQQSFNNSYQQQQHTGYQQMQQQPASYQQPAQQQSMYGHQPQQTQQTSTGPVMTTSNGNATPSSNNERNLASKYGDGFVTSASHPELAQHYGNVGTSNPYSGAARPGTAVISPTREKALTDPAKPEVEPELSVEDQTLLNPLQAKLSTLSSSVASVMEQKQCTEINKSLECLSRKLARGQVNEKTRESLESLATAIQNGDYGTAGSIQSNLVNHEWKEHKDWLKGMKLLIQVSFKKGI